jgi:transposase
MVFRIRELLIRQRTQAINALWGHLGEFGQIVPQGAANAAQLIAIVEDPESGLHADAIATLQVLVAALAHLETEIGKLDAEISRRAKEHEVARRVMTIPGIGPLIAMAIAALAPPPETFRKARDFLRRVARPDTPTAFHGRQAAAWCDDEDGRTILATTSDHWRQQRHHQTARPCHREARHLAWRDADAQATYAGAGSAGEQDGADRLGHDGQGRRLPASGRGGVSHRRSRGRRSERGQGAVWRNGRETGSEEPACNKVPSSTRR